MNRIILYILLISGTYACNNSNETSEEQSNDVEITNNPSNESKKVIPNQIMHAKIQGMMCEMGCGGAIRTNLKKQFAVSKVEFDFVENAENQNCKIYFNDKKVTQSEIEMLVESMNDRQFKMDIDSIISNK